MPKQARSAEKCSSKEKPKIRATDQGCVCLILHLTWPIKNDLIVIVGFQPDCTAGIFIDLK